MPFHGIGHFLRQVGLEASAECASHASQQAVIRIERFKRLRVVLNRVVQDCPGCRVATHIGHAEVVPRLFILKKTVILSADCIE